jgi:hypothetical protein
MDYRADYRCKRRDDVEDASRKEARRAVRRQCRLHRILPPRLAWIRNDPGTFSRDARPRRLLLAHLKAQGVPLTVNEIDVQRRGEKTFAQPHRKNVAAPKTLLKDARRVHRQSASGSLARRGFMNIFCGFLPEYLPLSISGRAAWYGPKGAGTTVPGTLERKIELNSEPIRLTLDASKAVWGAKCSHFVDVWVACRYWQNKFGLDHNVARA